MSNAAATSSKKTVTVYVCTNLRMSGNSCANQKSKDILKAMRARADQRALEGEELVLIKPSVCMGYCGEGPNVKIIGGAFHHRVGLKDIEAILNEAQNLKTDG